MMGGVAGFAGWSVIPLVLARKGEPVMPETLTWETTQVSHSSLLFGGNISLFLQRVHLFFL